MRIVFAGPHLSAVADLAVALQRLGHEVAALLPGLIPDPVRIGAYLDGYTADHHAAVGRAPGRPNTLLACGFSGHGFKLAPAIGLALAQLATDGHTELPIGHLDPARALPEGPPRRMVADELTVSAPAH